MRARGRRIESRATAKKDRSRYLGIAQCVAITETILMEVLAGATAGEALARIGPAAVPSTTGEVCSAAESLATSAT